MGGKEGGVETDGGRNEEGMEEWSKGEKVGETKA